MRFGAFCDSVYYPASGLDLSPIGPCILSGLADRFIYADCGVAKSNARSFFEQAALSFMTRRERLERFAESDLELDDEAAVLRERDYSVDLVEDVPLEDLFPPNSVDHFPVGGLELTGVGVVAEPYALLARFRKLEVDRSAAHWPETILLLFLGTEAISTYDRLFCQEGRQAPRTLAMKRHMDIGWEDGSPLHRLAQQTGILPRYLLMLRYEPLTGHRPFQNDQPVMDALAEPRPWDGYEPIDGDIWRRIL